MSIRREIDNKSFLVVDDFGEMRSMLRNMLAGMGIAEVHTARDGETAIAAMEQKRFDVVLCDYNLGEGQDGQQVLEEARHRGLIRPGAVFIMVTAENTRGMVIGAVENEPDAYLTKPVTKDTLYLRLDKLLAKKRMLLEIDTETERHNFDRAIELLDARLAERPKNPNDLLKQKAALCLRADRLEDARAIYQQALAAREMPWARMGLGEVLYASGQYAEARAMFAAIVDEHENITAAYDWLAKTHERLGQLGEAQRVLARATELSPKAIRRQANLGAVALKNGDTGAAEKAFGEAVRLGRHSVHRHPSLVSRLAKIKSHAQGPAAALKVLKEMKALFPGDQEADLFAATAEVAIHSGAGNADAAAKAMEKAEALYEAQRGFASTKVCLEMAQACHHTGNEAQARQILTQAVRNNHADDELLEEVGEVLDSLGLESDPKAFVEEIRREIVKLNNEGVRLAKDGSLSEAMKLFEESADGMAGNKVVNLNAARIFIMNMRNNGVDANSMGRVQTYLDRVKRLDPENATLRKIQASLQSLLSQAS